MKTCDMCIKIPTDFFENFMLLQVNGYNNWKNYSFYCYTSEFYILIFTIYIFRRLFHSKEVHYTAWKEIY